MYLQEQGLSPHARCANAKCPGGASLIIYARHEEGCGRKSKFRRRSCETCRRSTDLRRGNDIVEDMSFMREEAVFDKVLKTGLQARLRGQLTDNEFKKYVDSCRNCTKSTGQTGTAMDRYGLCLKRSSICSTSGKNRPNYFTDQYQKSDYNFPTSDFPTLNCKFLNTHFLPIIRFFTNYVTQLTTFVRFFTKSEVSYYFGEQHSVSYH